MALDTSTYEEVKLDTSGQGNNRLKAMVEFSYCW